MRLPEQSNSGSPNFQLAMRYWQQVIAPRVAMIDQNLTVRWSRAARGIGDGPESESSGHKPATSPRPVSTTRAASFDDVRCELPIPDDEKAVEARTGNGWAHVECWYAGVPLKRDPKTGRRAVLARQHAAAGPGPTNAPDGRALSKESRPAGSNPVGGYCA
jgi:hypothetical protein